MFADRKYGPQPVQVTVIPLISTQIFPALFHVLSYHTVEENSCLNQNIWSLVITSFIVKTFLYDIDLCWGLKSLHGLLLESTQGRI